MYSGPHHKAVGVKIGVKPKSQPIEWPQGIAPEAIFMPKTLVPRAGFEPACPCGQRILSPPRLPFRHLGLSVVIGCLDRPTQETPVEPTRLPYTLPTNAMNSRPSLSFWWAVPVRFWNNG